MKQVHGVVIVIPADMARSELEGKDFWSRFKTFRQQIHDRGMVNNMNSTSNLHYTSIHTYCYITRLHA
jgi:hypothetical protein